MNAAETPRRLLRWTRFASDPSGTGPEKRSAQIQTLARSAGFELHDMRPPARTPRGATLLAGLSARLRFGRRGSVDQAGIGLSGYRSLFYRRELAAHTGAKVLLWETTYDHLLPSLARRAGYRVIALPHNLESLVSEQVFSNPAYDPMPDLSAEISRLSLADHVFTISREERWLLEARGLNPTYLPFHPFGALADDCHALRARREAAAQTNGRLPGPLLMLGSAFNPATARGMAWQLECLRRGPATLPDIVVVGPSTDTELGRFASSRVSIQGRVSRDRLVELLAACSSLLVHTHGGGGAVTRLPEALAAGVPVIANANAARDQFGTPGLLVYETEEEFIHLAASRPCIPPAPPAPNAAFRRFEDTLRASAAPAP